ncbi:uncharacterized protein PRCAT00004415001 [Priceomyces carsonii]|uniref:uncharacterized protein n=1 Tax=Priceomyces carsonii TaxID=28549 RepID=UPI002ED79FDB|nr:unnamed protein product [Priceomyces carsonii]
MYEELKPLEKKNQHGVFGRFFFVFVSFISSFIFATVLATCGLFYHWGQKLSGAEKYNVGTDEKHASSYTPQEPFPNLDKMKPSSDLRYYALQLELDLEVYKITTEDGYVLPLHRLIDPKETVLERQNRKPILLQHGLLASSGSYITSGRNSLAYYFLGAGFDVWMGNNRACFEPIHTHFTGNLMNSEKYWDWDIRNLAYYDLPCIIQNVLAHKPNHEKLVLVGHLQGCTQSFLMLKNGNLSHLHKNIEFFFPLAPAIFPGPSFHDRAFIKFMHNKGNLGFKLIFGCCAFMRNLTQTRYYLYSTKIFAFLAYILFKYLFGWTAKRWGPHKKVWHFHFIFIMSYVSSRLMTWWLSHWVPEGFSNQLQPKEAYDSGANYAFIPEEQSIPEKDDSKSFFPFKRPWFDNLETTVPMVIFDCELDFLVDCKRLITHMRHYENSYKEGSNFEVVEIRGYNHVDITWADDVIGTVGYVITDKLKSLNATEITETDIEKDDDSKHIAQPPNNS